MTPPMMPPLPTPPRSLLHLPERPICRVRLLGPFEVCRESGCVEVGWRRKTVELLAYLAAHPKGAAREVVSEALWPEADPHQARRSLSRCLSELRQNLGGREASARVVLGQGERCRLNLEEIWVDVMAFEHAVSRADHPELWLASALDLYRGDFAEGAGYPWSTLVAEHLRQLFLGASLALAQRLEAGGRLEEAISLLDHAVARDPYNEELCRHAMRIEAQRGRHDMVARRFRRLRRLLLEDLDVEPSQTSASLLERLTATSALAMRPGHLTSSAASPTQARR